MRIVTAATFLAMPAGTVFAKFNPNVFGELMVKAETTEQGNDFYYVSPTDEVDEPGPFVFEHEIYLEEGTPVPLDFNTVMRDGMYDMNQLYAVWERKDVEGLIGRLHQALQDGYPVPPPDRKDQA